MGPSLRNCCVPGCYDSISKRHVIPKHKHCREIWLKRINNVRLFELEDRLVNNYNVCESHFEDACLINGKLRKFALPTLNLLNYVKINNDCFFNKSMLRTVPTDEGEGEDTVGSVKKPTITYGRKNPSLINANEELPVDHISSPDSKLSGSQEISEGKRFDDNIKSQIEKTCCVCLNAGTNYNKVSKKSDNKIALLTKLKTCIPEIIWVTFYYICSECTNTLNVCYEFRETCLKSESIRKNLKNTKVSEESKEECEAFDGEICQLETDQHNTNTDSINDILKEELHDLDDVNDAEDQAELSFSNEGADDNEPDSPNEENASQNKIKKVKPASNAGETNTVKRRKSRINFFCEKCSIYFASSIKLLNHCMTEHGMDPKKIKPFVCDRCPMRFYSSSNLWQHVKYHNGIKSNICSYCGSGFITKTDLMNHEKKHQNKREYQCDICFKTFNTHKNIRSHKLIVHTDSSTWKYVCGVCNKRFPIKSNYDNHMRRHTGEKKFNCHLCEKKFTTKCDLQRHRRSHSYVRDQKCQHCDKEYKDQRVLKIHLAKMHGIGTVKIPVKEKRHICHFCSKAYYDKNKLTRHLYTHSGEKPFSCPVCDKKFNDKSYIKQHLRNTHNVDTNDTLENELNINYMDNPAQI